MNAAELYGTIIPFATKPSNRRLRSRSRRSRRKSFSMLTGSSGNGSSLQSSASSTALARRSATLEAANQLSAMVPSLLSGSSTTAPRQHRQIDHLGSAITADSTLQLFDLGQ